LKLTLLFYQLPTQLLWFCKHLYLKVKFFVLHKETFENIMQNVLFEILNLLDKQLLSFLL
jgi:hypothetical protein